MKGEWLALVVLAAPAAAQVWETRAPLPLNNSETAVAELEGRIYVIGGYPPSGVTQSSVQVYDAASNSWTITTPLPQAVHHSTAAAVGGKLYVLGGQAANGSFSSNVYAFDPAGATWSARAPIPTPRGGGAAVVIDGKIYVVGGRPPHGSDFAVYDPIADAWQTLPDMPTQRNHVGAGVIGGKLYVAAGRLGAGFSSPQTGVLEVYDPAGGSWSSRAPIPTVRSGVNAIAAYGELHVWGGESSQGIFDEHEVYDPASDTWHSAAPLPTAIHGVVGAALIGGWIHQPGGGTSVGGSSGSKLHQVYRLPQGATFCSAKLGLSCGTPGITATGEPSASASGGYVVSSQPARGCRAGILLYNSQSAQPVAFQGGSLCIAAQGLRRAGSTSSGGTAGQCDGAFTIDMNAFAQGLWVVPDCAGAPAGIPASQPAAFLRTPGTQVYSQFWGRDSLATGSFLSSGLTFLVGP